MTAPHENWTPEDVRRWLVATFIALPTTPVYSKPGGAIGAVSLNVPDASFNWIALLNEVIQDRSVRLSVLVWAKSEARRQTLARKLPIEIPCCSIPDHCEAVGISRQAFDKRIKASLAKLARARSQAAAEMEEAA